MEVGGSILVRLVGELPHRSPDGPEGEWPVGWKYLEGEMKTIKISNTLRSWTEEDMKEIHAILAAKDGEFVPVRDVNAEHLRCLSGMSEPKPYPEIRGYILI
jgi:hypothetical protein